MRVTILKKYILKKFLKIEPKTWSLECKQDRAFSSHFGKRAPGQIGNFHSSATSDWEKNQMNWGKKLKKNMIVSMTFSRLTLLQAFFQLRQLITFETLAAEHSESMLTRSGLTGLTGVGETTS